MNDLMKIKEILQIKVNPDDILIIKTDTEKTNTEAVGEILNEWGFKKVLFANHKDEFLTVTKKDL